MDIPAVAVYATPERSGRRPDQPTAPRTGRDGSARNPTETAGNSSQARRRAEGESVAQIRPSLTNGEIQVSVPLNDLDLHQIHVFAKPRSLLIESRRRERLHLNSPDLVTAETIEQRTSYKLALRDRIARGRTSVEIVGRVLFITCQKAADSADEEWSEWLNIKMCRSLVRKS